jgi:hypothetical protein
LSIGFRLLFLFRFLFFFRLRIEAKHGAGLQRGCGLLFSLRGWRLV